MELSKLKDHPITAIFEDKGDEVEITFNANAFTPSFLKRAAEQIRQLAKAAPKPEVKRRGKKAEPISESELAAREMEQFADIFEIQRKVFAKLLTDPERPIIQSWDVTENGQPVKPSYEVLVSLHPRTVIGLWDFCLETASPKKQQTEPTLASQTTSETTAPGSGQGEISEASPTM